MLSPFLLIQVHPSAGCKCDNTEDLHVPQVFRDWDGDLVEGVSRGRAVGIEGSDAIRRDDLIVRGVARRIFNHIELERG